MILECLHSNFVYNELIALKTQAKHSDNVHVKSSHYYKVHFRTIQEVI